MDVSAIPAVAIEPLYDQLIPILEKVEPWTRGRYTAADLVGLCEEGRAFLFVAYEPDGEGFVKLHGAVVCHFNDYPRQRWLFILAAGGDSSALWRENMRELLEEFAVANKCVGFEWGGRLALLRLFPESETIGILGEIRFVNGRGPT